MKRREISPSAAQIKDEIRKLNWIEKSEFHRSFDEEAAVNLVLRIEATGDRAGMQGKLKAVDISPRDQVQIARRRSRDLIRRAILAGSRAAI
jgi:hypothetical protein